MRPGWVTRSCVVIFSIFTSLRLFECGSLFLDLNHQLGFWCQRKRRDSHAIITSPRVILIPDILAYCTHGTDHCSPYRPIRSQMRIFCHCEGLKEQVREEGCDHPNRSLRRPFPEILGRKMRQPTCPWSLEQKQTWLQKCKSRSRLLNGIWKMEYGRMVKLQWLWRLPDS